MMRVCVLVLFEEPHACQFIGMRFFVLSCEVSKLVVHVSVFLEERHAREILSLRILGCFDI